MVEKSKKLPFILPCEIVELVEEWHNGIEQPKFLGLVYKSKKAALRSLRIWGEVAKVELVTPYMIVLKIEEVW